MWGEIQETEENLRSTFQISVWRWWKCEAWSFEFITSHSVCYVIGAQWLSDWAKCGTAVYQDTNCQRLRHRLCLISFPAARTLYYFMMSFLVLHTHRWRSISYQGFSTGIAFPAVIHSHFCQWLLLNCVSQDAYQRKDTITQLYFLCNNTDNDWDAGPCLYFFQTASSLPGW